MINIRPIKLTLTIIFFVTILFQSGNCIAFSIENLTSVETTNKNIDKIYSSVVPYKSDILQDFCKKVNKKFRKFNWKRIICNHKTWSWDPKFITKKGHPLIYKVFEFKPSKSTTLVMCGVHGDELPTVYQCIHLVRDILFDNPHKYQEATIIIAPLINPDGFLVRKPTRQSGNGVDLNRNFPTRDFDKDAIAAWKKRYRSTPRKYPGPRGGSEIETQFQMLLIEKFKPDKIISLHSPYGWLDMYLPREAITFRIKNFLSVVNENIKKIRKQAKDVGKLMSKKSNNYPLTSFRFFPGSLGNYAANERSIPTYTLELPTSSARNGKRYWNRINTALTAAINFELNIKDPKPSPNRIKKQVSILKDSKPPKQKEVKL